MLRRTQPSAANLPRSSAAIYGLEIQDAGIQDNPNNITRSINVGAEMSRPSGRDKAGIVVHRQGQVGALHEAVGVFARRGINLSNIQSRPSRRRARDYFFFVELVWAPRGATRRGLALKELEDTACSCKVLGAWPVI